MLYGEDVEEGRSTTESAQPGHFRGGGGWRKKDGEPGIKGWRGGGRAYEGKVKQANTSTNSISCTMH